MNYYQVLLGSIIIMTQKKERCMCRVYLDNELSNEKQITVILYVLTFFEFIHHDYFEGALITLLFLFLLSCLPGLTLDTIPRSLAHSQLGLDRTYTRTETLAKTKKLKACINIIRHDMRL